MIKTEYYDTRDDGVILVKTYSTENKYIKQLETNLEYDIAIDVGILENGVYKPKNYTYEETNDEIKEDVEQVELFGMVRSDYEEKEKAM